jgi:hypothetical protein
MQHRRFLFFGLMESARGHSEALRRRKSNYGLGARDFPMPDTDPSSARKEARSAAALMEEGASIEDPPMRSHEVPSGGELTSPAERWHPRVAC